jgi:hypothetical protein
MSSRAQRSISRNLLLTLVRRMRPSAPITDKWLPPQELGEPNKQHWIGYLQGYDCSGHYHPLYLRNRDASETYNHVDCVSMLGWLAEHAGLPKGVVDAALREAGGEYKAPADCFRRVIPWADVQIALLTRAQDSVGFRGLKAA